MSKKISVVVTCYNHESYIEQCLRSIFNQTYPTIELLVFNDGSTDHSEQIIQRVLKESPFSETHVFSAENQGVSKVRNQALKRFTGDYLFFLDSDDFLNEDHLEQLLETLNENNADIAYCQLWDFEHQRNMLRNDLEFSLEKELEGNLISISSLVRREILRDIWFDETLKNLEDYDFWLNVFMTHQAKPVFSPRIKLNYRVLENSRSERDQWETYYCSYFTILKKYQEKIPNEILSALKANIFIWLKGYQVQEQKGLEQKKEIAQKDGHIKNFQSEVARLKEQKIAAELHTKQLQSLVDNKTADINRLNQEINRLTSALTYRVVRKIKGIFKK